MDLDRAMALLDMNRLPPSARKVIEEMSAIIVHQGKEIDAMRSVINAVANPAGVIPNNIYQAYIAYAERSATAK